MTKFEQVGISYQLDADSVHEAARYFEYSCRVCCERGIRISCDSCAIRVIHEQTVAALNDSEASLKKFYERINA